MLLIGCSTKQPLCPKALYPKLIAIDRVPKAVVVVNSNSLDINNTLLVFNTIKALRLSENYYYNLIIDYDKLIKDIHEAQEIQ